MTISPLAPQVLALPYLERERLLAELLENLHDGETGEVLDSDTWDRSWAAGLDARLARRRVRPCPASAGLLAE